VSVATVRRRIRAGELEAETVLRPQGSAFMVRLPLDASAGVDDAYDRDQEPGFTTRTQASSEQAMVSLIQTTIGTVLGPLVAELAASRQANERQAEQLVSQAERLGRQSAELERAHAEIHALTDSAASGAAGPTSRAPGTFLRAWVRLDWLLVALVVALVVTGLLLAVRR
jgi:hypothetical protein